jgi:hypothetical protein
MNMDMILNNTNVKYIIIIVLILYISTVNLPLNSIVNTFYNSIFGKIIILLLIIYYSDGNKELGIQITVLLSLLYIILLNVTNTQKNITSYGKLINTNLIGGTVEEEDNLLSSEEESLLDDTEDNTPMEEEMKEEQDIDKKINNIIQEEIVLNKTDYENKIKNAKKLGVKHNKINTKLLKAQNTLNKETKKYKTAEEEYNKIMKDVQKYDTNKDGVLDHNDVEPEEDLIQEEMENVDEEMENVEEEMEQHMKNLKTIGGEFDKLVSEKKINGGGQEYNIDGYENQEFSTI